MLATMKRRSVAQGVMLVSMLMLLAGCGGVQGSHSVSPAGLLLPGLLKVEPPRSPALPPKPALAGGSPAQPVAPIL